MAGHSQFKNIMHRKGRQDAVRSKMFSKLAREITVAAKSGTPDPIDEPAPAAGDPERQGASRCRRTTSSAPSTRRRCGDAENYDAVRYEGYGPGGVAVIVEALTDNRNRSASNVRAAFTKAGGAMGETGSVSFMWDRVGEIYLSGIGRQRRQGHGRGDRSRRRRRAVGRGRPHHLLRLRERSARCRRRWKARSARPSR